MLLNICLLNIIVMTQFSKELLDAIWEKGLTDPEYDANFVRKDACGAWILRNQYDNRNNDFGWEVDHIYPESKLKELDVPQLLIDNIKNLRPLNWKNNVSKGTDYPNYRANIKAEDDHNIDCEDEKIINEKTQKIIQELYKDYL